MEKKDRRERVNELLASISKSTSPEMEWVREMLMLQFEDAKDRLIDAQEIDVPRIQGEARFLEKLHKQMVAAHALLRNREHIS